MRKGTKPLLEVKDLVLGFNIEDEFINVIDNVSFSINKGEIVGLVGESGCGKSITSLSVMRLLPRTAVVPNGEIFFNSKDLLKISEDDMIGMRGKEIAMIFQEPMTSLNPVYTIGDQISEILLLHRKMSKKEAVNKSIEKLKIVSIPSPEKVIKQYPHELSGGMRQRVMIAMAMACNPKVLIADEPTTALDVTIQAQILDLIKDLKDETQASILLITHDLGVVAEMCDYVIVMYAGRVVEEADIYSIYENPQHPYTVGLLKSLPTLNEIRTRLHTIKGTVPAPKDFLQGCRFAPRCERATDICFNETPPLIEVGDTHKVRCFLASNREEDK
ncbi:ABC transporter ATP-binding protein [Maledivibacter halophilus]|uniref:Peptide/nickel transport system ATP-binding protein n=1 Tax=Maledivibacter halophilus TaxID=36842 RepID=A0A1T5LK73_9FIRM|nr:ABC transporter ATP-binding protein [Maledivibacter halophilus]SKC76175.1 peptide/nickel transport system ATP-binding protein [Maledivibacter halophilus]